MRLQIENILENGFRQQNEYLRMLVKNTAPKINTFKDVQNIVRSGRARENFDIGDQFIVEKLLRATADVGASAGITSATVDEDKFILGCGEVKGGEYIFSYNGNSWLKDDGKSVNLADYGITVFGAQKKGDHVYVNAETMPLAFDIIGIDHDKPANTAFTHSMTLQLHDLLNDSIVFDAAEAAWYIDRATYPAGLAAGTYHFTLPARYDEAYGGGQTYHFTLTKAVPVGGQIFFGWGYNKQASECLITTFAAVGNSDKLESVGVATGQAGTAMPVLHTTDVTENTNCVHHIRYGSNSWAESSIRQWMNADGVADSWWEAKNVFDRPANANLAGFLNKLDPAFLDVVGKVVKKTQKSISDGYGMADSEERFFLLSRSEIFAGDERSADGLDGEPYEFYSTGYSDHNSPSTAEDSNRIKYRNGTAFYWWLRTPASGYGYFVRSVNPTGSLYYVSAYNSYGVAPACVIV